MSHERRNELFIKKLQQCCIIFDFDDIEGELEGKEAKSKTLEEIIQYITTVKNVLTEDVYPYIFNMISSNLFRTIPPQVINYVDNFDPEEDEPELEPSWPHLQLVYGFFLRFIESSEFNVNLARHFIDQRFILDLLALFDSEDPREREYLKTMLHRIYGKVLTLRAFIRKSINYIFLQFIYESERHNGIAELLEILGSIINGFTLPLKDEHKSFLNRVLLPMHKAKPMAMYHPQLAYCTVQFIDKDSTLAPKIIATLLRYWPKVNSPKEIMYLNELEEILMVTKPEEFFKVLEPVFKKLTECIMSLHFQISERALAFWKNSSIVNFVQNNLDSVLPIVLAGIYGNIAPHWNRNINHQIYATIKLFIESDPALFDECLGEYRKKRAYEVNRRKKSIHMWEHVVKEANKNKETNNVPTNGHSIPSCSPMPDPLYSMGPGSASDTELNEQTIKKMTEELDMLIEHIRNEKPEDAMTSYSIGGMDDSEYSMDASNIESMEQAFGHNQYIYDFSHPIATHMNQQIDQQWAARMSYSDMSDSRSLNDNASHISQSSDLNTDHHIPTSNEAYSTLSTETNDSPPSNIRSQQSSTTQTQT
ncbi:serine/threonine-protein phosphatase 2A 56 kDa regulatory subunit delta isoform [Mycoemilia scoparia]|uniref:Serine/threonine-protein phosphatase 2A 56 kDa regulatory subunit delta isoform n=1 Tax=Mycoemilia scoparia TaxID=417184 RepID=A0A9W8A0L0_9FUNG|nr:serine/threonine-protein phosphatase 2A 56 kDa regulatory subunit delta isoform [Mycoemilia scoparia]